MNLTWRELGAQIPPPPPFPKNVKKARWEEEREPAGLFFQHTLPPFQDELDMVFFIAPVMYWRNNSVYQFDGVAPHMANTSLPVSEHNYDTHAVTQLPQALCSTQTPPQ